MEKNYINNEILDTLNDINCLCDKIHNSKNINYNNFIELRNLFMKVSLYFDKKFIGMEKILKNHSSDKFN